MPCRVAEDLSKSAEVGVIESGSAFSMNITVVIV